jgi:hypothetical protein
MWTWCVNPVDRWPVVHGGLRAAVAKGLIGAHAGWCFQVPNLTVRGPKGGGLLGESHHEVGWWWGAHDLAGDETIRPWWNELR